MANLKKFFQTTRAKIELLEYGGEPRPYLGMSQIGHHCSRYLWYSFNWCLNKKHSARTERIFNAGHLFEPQIIKQLKEAGIEVFKLIPNTNENRKKYKNYKIAKGGIEVEMFGVPGEEQEEFIGFAGHAKGHNDGRVRGVLELPDEDHLLEIKAVKNSKFKEFVKSGVKKSSETYYGQMQRYMKCSGLKWALFIALNKDTAHLYIERIQYDEMFSQELLRKEQLIIMSDEPPFTEYAKDYYKCSYCSKKPLCHNEVGPDKNCRTCKYSDLENDGKWFCEKYKKEISTDDQRKGCDSWIVGFEN